MQRTRVLLVAWLCFLVGLVGTPALSAQEHAAQEPRAAHPAPTAGAEAQGGHGHTGHELRTLDMTAGDFFKHQFSHSVPYPILELGPRVAVGGKEVGLLNLYNVQPWQWVCLGLMLVVFLPVLGSFRSGRASRFTRIMRGFCLWVRDEMVYSVMGKEEGRAFVPLFLFTFFFIAFQNVIGLVPSAGHHFPAAIYTATGTPYVTGALAAVTLLLMLGLGIKKNGLSFFKNLVPHGLPLPLVPIMFVIELISLFVKPFALTIRLFANMLAGHLVIASAIALIFLFTKMQGGAITSYLTLVPCIGMAIFIYIIEAFVTLLQAYIFTFLSINFIWQSMHQDH